MASFATAEDLATHMQQDFSAAETATATQALAISTQAIQDFLGQEVEETESDEVVLNGSGDKLVVLPQWPVTAVTSIELNGTLLVEGTEYAWYSSGLLEKLRGSWGKTWQSIEIVYTHGYPTIPDSVKGVCLELAAEMMSKPVSGLQSKSIEDASWTYREGNPVALDEDQKRTLIPYSQLLLA